MFYMDFMLGNVSLVLYFVIYMYVYPAFHGTLAKDSSDTDVTVDYVLSDQNLHHLLTECSIIFK